MYYQKDSYYQKDLGTRLTLALRLRAGPHPGRPAGALCRPDALEALQTCVGGAAADPGSPRSGWVNLTVRDGRQGGARDHCSQNEAGVSTAPPVEYISVKL